MRASYKPFVIVPNAEHHPWSPSTFIEALPEVVRAILVNAPCGSKATDVLRMYIERLDAGDSTFQAIGSRYGITKQAAQQLVRTLIQRLRRLFSGKSNRGYNMYIRPEFLEPLKRLCESLPPDRMFPASVWTARVKSAWNLDISEQRLSERLLLEIIGLRRLEFTGVQLRPVVVAANRKIKTRIEKAARKITQILSSRPNGATIGDVIRVAKTNPTLRGLTKKDVPVILRSMTNVERRGKKYFLVSRLRADHYFQILEAAGKPLHYRELGRQAKRFGFRGDPKCGESVTYSLRRDPRFVRLREAGMWSLAKWRNPETRTIVQLAYDEIEKAGQPLHQVTLYKLIRKRRTLKPKSVKRLLGLDARFFRVAAGTWQIKRYPVKAKG